MKKSSLILLILVFVVMLAGAAVAYNALADRSPAQQLATAPAVTEATPSATQTAQSTLPESTPSTEPSQTEEPQPEDFPAPDFTVFDFEGNEVQFADFVGKPIVLNFWATWCGPCQSEMPGFNKVYEELDGEVVFLMVNAMEERDVVHDYIHQQGFTFPVFLDTLGSATGTYGITSYPTTFFIDEQGNLITYAIGAIDEETLMIGVNMIYTP